MSLDRAFVAFELKALADTDGARTFEGYGSVFNTVDSYNDTVAKGAYKQTLREWKALKKLPKMLLQHGGGGFFSSNADDMVPIGKWEEMFEDDHGLFMKGRLFDVDTDRAKATYAALKEGELDGLSIGFRTRKSKMDEETGVRTLTEIQLFEVSLVTFPANDPARVTAVKADGELPTEREFERWLRREAGFTEAHAKTIIAKGFRQVRREAMPSEEASEQRAAFLDSVKQLTASLTGA
jgi:HK97 family phage prohead protease